MSQEDTSSIKTTSEELEEQNNEVKRSDSRRSPTTGHRRRVKESNTKRSHSIEIKKVYADKLTSSEEDLIEKCKEIIEQTKKHQQPSKLTKRKVKRDQSQPKKQKNKTEKPSDERKSWWNMLWTSKKIEVKEEITTISKKDKHLESLNVFELLYSLMIEYKKFKYQYANEVELIKKLCNRCFTELFLMFIICGLGGMVFKTTEGSFESFYKCGVKRVKRDFVEELWRGSHFLREDEWKSKARRKLMDFENQLQDAFEAGMKSYSGQRSWSFLNAVIYSLTVVTTIGYGHLAPVTTTGRALTIAYSIIGIPLFLILLADFGKLFTRSIKFGWAFVRRFYYTGTCRKARRSAPVQEMMKGVQIMYDLAHLRRPSQVPGGEEPTGGHQVTSGTGGRPDLVTAPLPPPPISPSTENPPTPALSTFAIDDEFNLPISVAITILLVYIFLGALVFWFWEDDWTFFEAFYFVFISMSTIGFGDLVPQNQMYMMASIVYLAFGLALTSMCINVVQEKLSDTFRQASAKIGATIGLKVSEDDGTISPVTPTRVELFEIHPTFQSQPQQGFPVQTMAPS